MFTKSILDMVTTVRGWGGGGVFPRTGNRIAEFFG
jgi:hypothetical protein